MRLAIADPPYLGRACYYGGTSPKAQRLAKRGRQWGNADGPTPADQHPDADKWDRPEAHLDLVTKLTDTYDGWAIAMARDSLHVYLSAAPNARVAVWHNPSAWPPGNRIHATWEPVLLSIPAGRRAIRSAQYVKDVLVASSSGGSFVGAKPAAWTRWVLDMLGYNPDEDTVDDLFGGSGAVTAEINQGVIL